MKKTTMFYVITYIMSKLLNKFGINKRVVLKISIKI